MHLLLDRLDHVLLVVEHDRPANESHELMASISRHLTPKNGSISRHFTPDNGSNISTFYVFAGRESTLLLDRLHHVLLVVEHDRPANGSHEFDFQTQCLVLNSF